MPRRLAIRTNGTGVRFAREKFFLWSEGAAMIAVALDPSAAPVAVAGRGPAALHRLRALRSAGATGALLFCDQPGSLPPDTDLGPSLRLYLPAGTDLTGLRALWITGLPDDLAAELAALARPARVLVNVEDRPALCDFHSVAEVRRGDLLLTVSTGGASPGLAARIRARLAARVRPGMGRPPRACCATAGPRGAARARDVARAD